MGWGSQNIKLIIFYQRHKCMTPKATRSRQFVTVLLVSLDPCCYLSCKKVNWFSFGLILNITKSVSTLRFGRSAFFCMLIIQSFLKYPQIQQICSAESIRGIRRNF